MSRALLLSLCLFLAGCERDEAIYRRQIEQEKAGAAKAHLERLKAEEEIKAMERARYMADPGGARFTPAVEPIDEAQVCPECGRVKEGR